MSAVRSRVGSRISWSLLPRLHVPLAEGDADVPLNLQAVLAQTYSAGSYRQRLDYGRPAAPSLRPEDEAWVRERVAPAA